MITHDILKIAVSRSILTSGQAESLIDLANKLSTPVEQPQANEDISSDDEKLRFITGFNDIFVSIGLILFLGALILLVREHATGLFISVTVAIVSWALAELFTRKRRMALPSLLLLAAFSLSVFMSFMWAGSTIIGNNFNEKAPFQLASIAHDMPLLTAAASLLTCICLTIHYRRFQVPITVAVSVATLSLAGISAVLLIDPAWGWQHMSNLLLVIGLIIFTIAMYFDFGDLERISARTDIAFWMHLLAASMIIHPLVMAFVGDSDLRNLDKHAALSILGIIVVLTFVSLIIDRRAILSASLLYAGFAFYTLIDDIVFTSSTLAWSALALGSYVLMISALWRPLRNSMLRLLPYSFASRLPRPVNLRA